MLRSRSWRLRRPGFDRFSAVVRCRNVSRSANSGTTKPYYITTPIFYPNSVPHIGHLYSLVTADIFARYQRLRDISRPVHFLVGTDEHGLKIQKAAKDQGKDPQTLCDNISQSFRDLAKRANINYSRFIRTTEPEHHKAVEHVWRELDAKGLIYKGSYGGWYSVSDECFYPESQVTRIPRGDEDVVVSTQTGSAVEWTEEENYMFRLSAFQESLLKSYKDNEGAIFPKVHLSHIIDILSSTSLEDLSISRPRSRLSWGIPVPSDPEHTVYVWFDALTVYLSGVGYPWLEREKSLAGLWPPDLQIIGKDILRFHAIYLPAMLQGLGLPLSRRLLTHAHWTMNQKKMSKSVGNVADPFKAMEDYGVDAVRYYMARIGGRFRDDVDWSDVQLKKYTDEIQSFLGNFLLRTTSDTMMARLEKVVPQSLTSIHEKSLDDDPNRNVISQLAELAPSVGISLQDLEIGEALDKIVNLLKLANTAMTNNAPWSQPPNIAQASIVTSLETLRICGICLQPFMPSVAEKLLDALGVPLRERSWDFAKVELAASSGKICSSKGKVGTITRGVMIFGGHRIPSSKKWK